MLMLTAGSNSVEIASALIARGANMGQVNPAVRAWRRGKVDVESALQNELSK